MRDFRRFQGGHLKVWNYFNHTLDAGWDARVLMTDDSRMDATNPWTAVPDRILRPGDAFGPDVRFLAGLDWSRLMPPGNAAPVINLIQHVRHADPADPRFQYLSRPAVRICVSQEVADAIGGTHRVRGPSLVIPNGIDTSDFPAPSPLTARPVDVVVAALKQKELGRRVAARLRRRHDVRLLADHRPRQQFLAELAGARVVVVLPDRTEGFCLPALEAMALGAVVVVPDVVGNRTFCVDGDNCLVVAFDEESVVATAREALGLSPTEALRLRNGAMRTASDHSLAAERQAFHRVLAELDALWREATAPGHRCRPI